MIYLSFCDPDKPEGTQWLGGAYVTAANLPEALTMSHLLGINPGGEVMFIEVPGHVAIKRDFADRLLSSRAEIDEAVIVWQE